MTQFFFHCDPWDLDLEGIDTAIARLAGDIGVDAISVTATSPAVYKVRARLIGDRYTFTSGAAAHFQPVAKHYAATRIRPIPAAWMKSRNPMEKICEAARNENLKIRVRISGFEGEECSPKYAYAARVNAFGDTSPTHLCPSHPEAREYAAALLEDLSTNYPIDTIELDGLDFGTTWQTHAYPIMPMGTLGLLLQTLCFCAACRQRAMDAGTDIQEVQRTILDAWRRFSGREVSNDEASMQLSAHTPTRSLVKVRTQTVTSLVQMIRGRITKRIRYNAYFTSELFGSDFESISPYCDGAIVPMETIVPANEKNDLRKLITIAGGARRCDAMAFGWYGISKGSSELVSKILQNSQIGYDAIGFNDYGLAPEPCLDWVRQAIRYARRESH